MISINSQKLELLTCKTILTKPLHIGQHKNIKRDRFEGVSKPTLYIINFFSKITCVSANNLRRKHLQMYQHYLPYRVVDQFQWSNYFYNLLKNSLMVTNQWRGNRIVWIVVNSKIPLIEIFHTKEQATALYSVVRHFEKLFFENRHTSTIIVERSTDKLNGVIPREGE